MLVLRHLSTTPVSATIKKNRDLPPRQRLSAGVWTTIAKRGVRWVPPLGINES